MKAFKRMILLLLLPFSSLGADVLVNQVGYPVSTKKEVYVTSPAQNFVVRDASSSQIVYEGALSLFVTDDPATGMTSYKGEFTELQTPGTYVIEVGSETSATFVIADQVYNELAAKAIKSFYFQRCGTALLGETAAPYYHSACHSADGFFHSATGLTGFHLSRKGWHDAGDYGKYIVNAGITVGVMLLAYEQFPDKFANDDLNIPESGNGVPDLLDEIRYELEWMLTMQAEDGGVYHKLTRENFSAFIMPQVDTETRYIYPVSTPATGDFTAVMARAARIYEEFDPVFAQACLEAAELSWNFLQMNLNPVFFTNPDGTGTGQYGDWSDLDERLWASAELFETTGDETYNQFFLDRYMIQPVFNNSMSWQDVNGLAHLTYLLSARPNVDPVDQNRLHNDFIEYCQGLVVMSGDSNFQVSMTPNDYVWGCHSTPLYRAIYLILAYEQTQVATYLDRAYNQLHFVLGANAHNMSFVTGVGETYPMFPHHRPSAADGIAEPIPGYLVGGPDRHLSDPVLSGLFDSNTPPALCYVDDQGSYASNEIAINWNAPLVFVAGYFSDWTATGIEDQGQISPNHFQMSPNFPNPFQNATHLEFTLARHSYVNVTIVDVTGRTIVDDSLGYLSAGDYDYTWNGQSEKKAAISSGIYFVSLDVGPEAQTNRVVYLGKGDD